jgi:hypothetical protein
MVHHIRQTQVRMAYEECSLSAPKKSEMQTEAHWCVIKLLPYFWLMLIDPIDRILLSLHLDIDHILLQLDGDLSRSYLSQTNQPNPS